MAVKPNVGNVFQDGASVIAAYIKDPSFGEGRLVSELGRVEASGGRKSSGTVYTPEAVVDGMVSMAAPMPWETGVEPSCGHGAFAFGLFRRFRKEFGMDFFEMKERFLANWKMRDLSETAVSWARAAIAAYFSKHGVPSGPEDFEDAVSVGDGLADFGRGFDVCVWNPPYVRTKNMAPETLDRLRSEFESCRKGNVDLYYAFVEKWASGAGRTCLVVPNAFLSNASWEPLRKILDRKVSKLVDFGTEKAFPGVWTYVCVILSKRDGRFESTEVAGSFSGPWTRAEPFSKASRTVRPSSVGVYSWIATLADKAFSVFPDGNGGFYGASPEWRRSAVEPGAVVPHLKVTKFVSSGEVGYAIFPYSFSDGKAWVIPESEFRLRFPSAYDYLVSWKGVLDSRDRGKVGGYEAWYAYGRKQGLAFPRAESYAFVPAILWGKCVPRTVRTERFSPKGGFVFSSGYAVPGNVPWAERLTSGDFRSFVASECRWMPWKEPYHAVTSKDVATFLAGAYQSK